MAGSAESPVCLVDNDNSEDSVVSSMETLPVKSIEILHPPAAVAKETPPAQTQDCCTPLLNKKRMNNEGTIPVTHPVATKPPVGEDDDNSNWDASAARALLGLATSAPASGLDTTQQTETLPFDQATAPSQAVPDHIIQLTKPRTMDAHLTGLLVCYMTRRSQEEGGFDAVQIMLRIMMKGAKSRCMILPYDELMLPTITIMDSTMLDMVRMHVNLRKEQNGKKGSAAMIKMVKQVENTVKEAIHATMGLSLTKTTKRCDRLNGHSTLSAKEQRGGEPGHE